MPYLFFFSYARANSDQYLKKFFDDLSDKLRDQLGLGPKEEVGFFDQPEMELGAEWTQKLERQVQACPVIVSMYSPAYFRSPYCGKEWECFRRRRELYVTMRKETGEEDVELPPVIKPVIWIPLMPGQSAPEIVGGPQYFMGDPTEDHNKIGLKQMRKQYATYETNYELYIEKLKNEILEAQQFALPEVPDFNGLASIESAFHQPDAGPLSEPLFSSPRNRGPKTVRFVFIAGNPDQFPAGARRREFYLQFGGPEWKPYYPDAARPIKPFAQELAGGLDLESEELKFAANLADEVRNAERDGSLVVLFVDAWTAELPQYRSVLENFDRYNYFNCSIFVPWNENDPETASRQEELRRLVRENIFRRWARLANTDQPIFFRDSIRSIDDLRSQLIDTLRQLQSTVGMGVMENATKETIPRRIETEISRPVLSHR